MFERGFKSWCENASVEIRKQLGLAQAAPISPLALAEYLGVRILSVDQIDGLEQQTRRILLETNNGGWSAVTVSSGADDWVIYNPTHSAGRQASDIMHELAHILIGHTPATVVLSPDAILATRSFNRQQEDEASWLAGCLLLPRTALLAIAASKQAPELTCRDFGVTHDLLEYRMNVSGARIQANRRASWTAKD
jgi:Zn-dependent peptidase ImmA (M78 family)